MIKKEKSQDTYFKVFKYRIYPNQETKEKFDLIGKQCRLVYNYFLEERIEKHKNKEPIPSDYDQTTELLRIRRDDLKLKKIHSHILTNVILLQLADAWRTFRKKIKK